jgi:hypothetical protein
MIEQGHAPRRITGFLIILASFIALDLLSWPIFFSYYLFVFADRSNFLNLDYLLDQHLRLGVDTFYQYGLIPVFVQHLLFLLFGRGYRPLIGCTVAVLILTAVFWAEFVRCISNRWLSIAAVIAISPILLTVNPNLPYAMVQLSMLFALLFLVEGHADIALAIAVIGTFSVPSLPVLLTGLLAIYIVAEWWVNGSRSISLLVRKLAPGVLTCLLLVVGLSLFFGVKSVLATALPFLGTKFYYGSGKLDYDDLITFLHPRGHSLLYYLAYYVVTPATWWMLCTVGLVILAVLGLRAMILSRRVDPRDCAVIICAALQVFFAVFAYRGNGQHTIYDPITAAGMFLGLSLLPPDRWRSRLLIVFTLIGVCAQAAQARQTLWAWKNTHPSALTANLYAEPEYTAQLAHILKIAKTQKVLMMSNATGVHHYYPSLRSADTWFLVEAQMFPADHARILADMRDADVVVEDTTHVPYFTDRDPEVQSELRSMCLAEVTENFQIWWRHPPRSAECKINQRKTASFLSATSTR